MSESQSVYSILPYLGILAAAIGAGVSSIVNYLMTNKEFKRRTKASLVEKRLDVYSYMIYYLDEMAYHHKGLSYTQRRDMINQERYVIPKEWEKIIREIDAKLRDNYFLVEHDILELWTWVKTQYFHPISTDMMPELRNRLIENYNEIAKDYKKILGVGVPSIHQKALEIKPKYKVSVTTGEDQIIEGIVIDSQNKEKVQGVKVTIQIIDESGNVLSHENKTTDEDGKFSSVWNVNSTSTGEHNIIVKASVKGYDIGLIREAFQVNLNPVDTTR